MNHLSTSLWTSPKGASQLLGLGIRASITGKHAYYVITDDICNKDDQESRAERERTKRQYDELQNIRNRGGRIAAAGQYRQVASKKVGGVSVTYSSGTSSAAFVSTDLADLTETSFGLQMLSLLKLYIMTRYVP